MEPIVSILILLLSAILTTLPAAGFWLLASTAAGSEYYWKSYFIVTGIFLMASFAVGFFLPALFPKRWKYHPTLGLFSQGLLAWFMAIMALGLINLTPLCIGQENGDGTNNLSLCMVETAMVIFVSSPLESILLCLMALPGGWLIKQLV